jgi:hypothetical protein
LAAAQLDLSAPLPAQLEATALDTLDSIIRATLDFVSTDAEGEGEGEGGTETQPHTDGKGGLLGSCAIYREQCKHLLRRSLEMLADVPQIAS